MSSQYIFTMYKLSRVHAPDKRVLEDISLSFLPGAKIGVLGLNGAGKSTLLRIMAGRDTEFRGDAQPAPGATGGLLERGPEGAGRWTVLRMMAGRDTEFRGDAQLAPGATVGLLEQEPQLDPDKDVRGNVEEGMRELRGVLG